MIAVGVGIPGYKSRPGILHLLYQYAAHYKYLFWIFVSNNAVIEKYVSEKEWALSKSIGEFIEVSSFTSFFILYYRCS
jgi:hypothetical protein